MDEGRLFVGSVESGDLERLKDGTACNEKKTLLAGHPREEKETPNS